MSFAQIPVELVFKYSWNVKTDFMVYLNLIFYSGMLCNNQKTGRVWFVYFMGCFTFGLAINLENLKQVVNQ